MASASFTRAKRFVAAELPGQLAPKGLDGLLAVLPRLAGRVGGAVEHGDARLWHVHQPGLIEERRDAGEVR